MRIGGGPERDGRGRGERHVGLAVPEVARGPALVVCALALMMLLPLHEARAQQSSGHDALVRQGQQELALMNRFAELESESRRHLRAGRFDEARRVAQQALALNISNRRANQLLAEIDAAAKAAGAAGPGADASRGASEAAPGARPGRVGPGPGPARASPEGRLAERGGPPGEGRGPVGGPVRDLLRAFFAGDYETVLATATRLESGNPSPRVLFYAACSEVALGVLDPASADERTARARALYARATAGGERFSEDRRFVSPRILEVLERQP